MIKYNRISTSLGNMLAASSGQGLCWLSLPGDKEESFVAWAGRHFTGCRAIKGVDPIIKETEKQVNEYLSGSRKEFSLQLDLRGTVFQRRVWQALLQVPYGTTVSYRDIAIAINKPRAVRAVGQANNKNPIIIVVPCHRVIGSDGSLVGYGGGLDVKRALLRLEGSRDERKE
ncbi:MAG: methylated-DNA--[protein]-cysteine S-methyltransferase [Mahellales bacterium]